ncbi:MAG: hypothetical protein JSR85_03855 [Proteobacteria bacterium]|nr:hypothetical protein [Pseudomonadota bacterium]
MMRTHLKYVISSLNFSPLKHLLRKTISFLLIVALIYPDLAKAMNGVDDEVPSSLISPLLPKDVPLPSHKSKDPLDPKDGPESPKYSPPGNESDLPHSHSSSPERSTGSSGPHDESPPHSLGSTPEEMSLNDTTNRSSSPLGKTPPLLIPASDSFSASPPSPTQRSLLSKAVSVAVPPDEVVLKRSDDLTVEIRTDSTALLKARSRSPESRPTVLSAFDTLDSLPFIATESSSRSSDLDDSDATAAVTTAVLPIPAHERHDDDRRDTVLSTSSSPEDVVITGSMLRFPPPLELQRVSIPPARPAASMTEPTERDVLLPKGRSSSFRHSHGSIQDADLMDEEDAYRGRPGSKRSSRVLSRDDLFSEVRVLRDVTDRSDDVEVGSDILERQALLQKVRTLDPGDPDDRKVVAFLQYAKDRINDGKFTWKQIILGGVGGTLIGTGVGNAMPPIFEGGLDNGKHTWWNRSQNLQTSLIVHTAITLGIDSISRNVKIIGDLVGPSMKEFSIPGIKLKCWKWEIDLRKGVVGLVYVGASMAALLPVYYLWSFEKWGIEGNAGPTFAKDSIIFVSCLAPTLFLDALFSNARAMQEKVDEFINARRVRRAFEEGMILSPARALRQQELSRFDDLIRLFRAAPEDDIHEFYEQILVNGFGIKKNGIDMPENTLKGADALRALKALRKIHETSPIPLDNVKSWKRKVAKVLGWGIPAAATAGRTLVFYAIIYSLLGEFGTNEIANKVLSGIFGGVIANLFQGKVEVEAVEAGVYDILHGDDPESDASQSRVWKGFRKAGKTYNFVQGVWNTLPYILVGIATTQGWPMAVRIATLLFFGVADAFNNTMAFNESYGGVVTGAESLLSYKHATGHYKRNKLVRLVRRYKQAYETMDPGVMMRVNSLLSGESGLIEDHGSSGVPLLISVNSEPHADHSGSDDGLQ